MMMMNHCNLAGYPIDLPPDFPMVVLPQYLMVVEAIHELEVWAVVAAFGLRFDV